MSFTGLLFVAAAVVISVVVVNILLLVVLLFLLLRLSLLLIFDASVGLFHGVGGRLGIFMESPEIFRIQLMARKQRPAYGSKTTPGFRAAGLGHNDCNGGQEQQKEKHKDQGPGFGHNDCNGGQERQK